MKTLQIEFLPSGLVAPYTKTSADDTGRKEKFDGGVYYKGGEVCSLGLQIKPARNAPIDIGLGPFPRLVGSHVFGGLLQNDHIGHFFIESLSRLWAFEHLGNSFKSVVFYLRQPSMKIGSYVHQVFDLLIPGVDVHIVQDVREFETLVVPQQLVQQGGGYMFGHPGNISFFKRLPIYDQRSPKRIYVSRAHLSPLTGGILGEDLICKYLAQEGYKIVYPEELTIREQIILYSSCSHVVFAEGSAIHLYALVCNPDQHAFMIYRRKEIGIPFAWQIRTFGGPALRGKSCVTRLWIPEHHAFDAVQGKAILNFTELSRQLHDCGFIEAYSWPEPDVDELESLILKLKEQRPNWNYVLHEQSLS